MSNDLLKYLIVFGLVLSWTLTPFCKKRAIGRLNNEEYFVVNFILTSVLAALFWIYLIKNGKTKVNVFIKMNRYEIVWALLAAIFSITGAIFLISLIKNYEVSYIMPQLNPCVIILTTILGFLIFGESISINKLLGISLIIVGLYVIGR